MRLRPSVPLSLVVAATLLAGTGTALACRCRRLTPEAAAARYTVVFEGTVVSLRIVNTRRRIGNVARVRVTRSISGSASGVVTVHATRPTGGSRCPAPSLSGNGTLTFYVEPGRTPGTFVAEPCNPSGRTGSPDAIEADP